jgi:transcriptional regulator with XRE-family HTH domain
MPNWHKTQEGCAKMEQGYWALCHLCIDRDAELGYRTLMGTRRTALGSWMADRPELRLTEFAKEIGISQGYLSRLRSGKRRPGAAVATRLAARTGIGLLELLGLCAEESEGRPGNEG